MFSSLFLSSSSSSMMSKMLSTPRWTLRPRPRRSLTWMSLMALLSMSSVSCCSSELLDPTVGLNTDTRDT